MDIYIVATRHKVFNAGFCNGASRHVFIRDIWSDCVVTIGNKGKYFNDQLACPHVVCPHAVGLH